ncbi:MAG: hypothetical protein IT546_14000 [Caulobacteraceae bacterium]|nr:hypothetical protein [Caulobacteraceae bacterium]
MKTPGKIVKTAAAGAIVLALAAPASQAFAGDKTRNAVIGGLLGAVAGAAISDGDGGATVAGGALGALVGVAIANDGRSHRYYRDGRGRTYYRDYRGRNVYDDYYARTRHYRSHDRYDRHGYSRYDTRYGYYR